MADVVNFPKRFTSYRVAFLPFPDSPLLLFTMQCPYDKVDEFLTYLFSMPPEESFFYEVHGHLADGTTEIVRGDINAAQPRGRVTIRHSAIVFPGSTLASDIRIATARYIEEESKKMTAGIKRRTSLTHSGGLPAKSASQQATEEHVQRYKDSEPPSVQGLLDSDGKPRFRWDAGKAQYVEKSTGRCINQEDWDKMKEARAAAQTTPHLANTPSSTHIPPADVVAAELKKIVGEVDDALSAFPVVLTSIEIEEFK